MLADRHLQLLALGTGMAAFDLPVELGPVPLSLPLRLAGIAIVVIALWGLRPSDKPLERRATRDLTTSAGMVVLWGILLTLQLLSHARGGLIGPLAQVVLLVPFVLVARVMERFAIKNAWSYAEHAWRRALYLSAVCYGSSLVVHLVSWIVGLVTSIPVDPASHPVLELVGPLWLLVPVVAVLVAVGRTSRDQAQLEGEPLTPLSTAVHRKAAPALVLLALLLPHWAIAIPRQVHHLVTPDFLEHVRTRRAVNTLPELPKETSRISYWTGPTWRHGVISPLRAANDPFPEGLRSQSYRLEVKLHHGPERLLAVDQELLATIDADTNTLDGIRIRTTHATVHPAFRLVVHTRVDLDAPHEAASAGSVHRVPFQIQLQLLAGRGTLVVGGERVKGLTVPNPDAVFVDAPQDGGLTLRGGPIHGALPPQNEGLRYVVLAEGALTFHSNGELVLDVPTRTRFSLNGDEYSYTVKIDEQLVQQDQNPARTRRKGPATIGRVRRWRGATW